MFGRTVEDRRIRRLRLRAGVEWLGVLLLILIVGAVIGLGGGMLAVWLARS